jgi:hypothetical protein
MRKLKGKDEFTTNTICKIEELIKLRIKATASEQKGIRQKMRNLDFYGQDDWRITDMQISDLHFLIKSEQIKIIGGILKPNSAVNVTNKPISNTKPNNILAKGSIGVGKILERFKANCFDPKLDEEIIIDDCPGNYIICLRKNSKLPDVSISPILTKFESLDVIYTGIAGGSLRTRDFRQHFIGNNAGRSTLRKSLGVLFGYKLIPRDKDPNTGKTKFVLEDEKLLTEWMLTNLKMFFLPSDNFNSIEIKLINHFNPPLNLKDNKNINNRDFRQLLSRLRANKS